MMNDIDIRNIISTADMIVGGYAFTSKSDGNISIVSLHGEQRACVIRPTGEMLETNMNDVEMEIVTDYWMRNRKHMEDSRYAEVL